MLADDYKERLNSLIATSELKIDVPEKWRGILSRRGPTRTMPDDDRRFVRFYFPAKAMLELHETLPNVSRAGGLHQVLTKDLSRSGISFLHAGQIFPCEELTLWLPSGKKRFTAARCTRLNARCYEIGARLV